MGVVPPQTAAIVWMATRTMLFSACCAVSVQPAVWVWKRSICALGLVTPKRSFIMRAQILRAARNFATSSRKSLCALKKNERRLPNTFGSCPALMAASM